MMDEKSKDKSSGGGLALLAKLGRKPKSESGEMDSASSIGKPKESSPDMGDSGLSEPEDMDAAGIAIDDVADSLGVAPDKRAEFGPALRRAVQAILDSGKDDSGLSDDSMAAGLGR